MSLLFLILHALGCIYFSISRDLIRIHKGVIMKKSLVFFILFIIFIPQVQAETIPPNQWKFNEDYFTVYGQPEMVVSIIGSPEYDRDESTTILVQIMNQGKILGFESEDEPADANDDGAIALLRRYSLVEITGEMLSVHRLVQAVARDRLAEDERKKWAEAAVNLVNNAFPRDSNDVRIWPICSQLLLHAQIAVEHAETLEIALESTMRLLNETGIFLKSRAQFVEAKKNYERALAIGEAVYGPDHPDVAICVNNLGGVLKSLGDIEGAKKNYERALAIDEAVYGPDHPDVAIDVNNLGGVLRALGDIEGAKKNYERALAIGEAVYGPDHPTVAIRVNNLGSVLKALGDFEGAKKNYERALEIFGKYLGKEHPNTLIVKNNLDDLLAGLNTSH